VCPRLALNSLFFSFSTGVWTQGLTLARKVFYHLSHVPRPGLELLNFLPQPLITGITGVPPCLALFVHFHN
jgi:hypothetical protein